MNTDLRDYIKVYNLISKDVCEETMKHLQQARFDVHSFYDAKNGVEVSPENTLKNSWDDIPNKNKLMDIVSQALRNYLDELQFPWFNNLQGFSNIRFNKYETNTLMDTHCDHIHSMFEGPIKGVPVLSVVGVLNDDYEGGEFIMFDNDKIELSQGDMLVFPSGFMYPHKVQQVTKGTRHSFVSWAA